MPDPTKAVVRGSARKILFGCDTQRCVRCTMSGASRLTKYVFRGRRGSGDGAAVCATTPTPARRGSGDAPGSSPVRSRPIALRK
eukprot:gene10780-biopygen6219